MYGTAIRGTGVEHPLGWHDETSVTEWAEFIARGWGTRAAAEVAVPIWAPSMTGEDLFTEWLAQWARNSVSRNEVRPLLMNAFGYDLADLFPAVRVPALVLGRRGDQLALIENLRHIARLLPDARLVELDGDDHLPFVGDAESVAVEIEDFLVGSRSGSRRQRRLVSLLTVAVVDATRPLDDLGDDAWRELLAAHDRDLRHHLSRFGGRQVKQLGDGAIAVLDGPVRAIRCALGIVDAAERRGLRIRCGVHVGECELIDDTPHGIVVQTGERLAEIAAPGEILVSATAHDLVAGSGVRFGDGRDVELPGATVSRPVFSVLRGGAPPDAVRRMAVEQENVLRLDGDYWTVGHRGLVVTVRDSKGLRDLSRLLAQPGRELHVLDLATEGGARGVDVQMSHAPVIDDAARAAYKRRIGELEADIDEAHERGDDERTTAARRELDALVDALTAAYGLGGRARPMSSDAERARKAVTRRVRDAMARIDQVHPALGRHLRASIHTGTFCRYEPDRDMVWTVGA